MPDDIRNKKFEEIVRRNKDVNIDLTKINTAISTFKTYVDEKTELLWKFFCFGCYHNEDK